ncbi:murein biosynthesis integral membrane protein MurJ [Streptomyces albogriseolus]|uniref:Transmembrane protein n=1 Tax=Streptomyces sp. F2 TaxID=317660 RepID=V9Z5W4_9ACTN|nr:murein biosynthesis integral membrane protein MurJ [Streptomyces sp. F2]AHE39379.1 Transmembrane protein [Streptomyces sp. F2]
MTAQEQAEAATGSDPKSRSTPRLRGGAVMMLGSLASRATGFVRGAVVVAALGTALLGDAYNVANTVPNIVYILLIGGALNSVFVPELVRAAKEHADGGAAYTDRLLTLCLTALTAITTLAVLAAPWIVSAYTDYTGAQRDLTVALARYCLPQIFFYGVFTVLGQVLNARDRFGAMMWTPVLNNVAVIAVFGLYLVIARTASTAGEVTDGQLLLLGLGSTAGIAVQALALLPSLRAAGFRWRPRFDWRGSGLGRPVRAAVWTLLLVLVNQVAYWVVTRLSTSAAVRAVAEGVTEGVGYTAYSSAYQLWVVPQGIITVSLVTALLPRMSRAATDGDLAQVSAGLSRTLRTTAVAIVPAVFLFLVLAPQLAGLAYQYGQVSDADARAIGWVLAAFAPGLAAFSAQYVLSRGFYALGDTRTPFLLTLVIAGVNAGLSVASYVVLPARWAVTGIAAAYAIACTAGLCCTALVLRRRLGRPLDRALGTHLRLGVACLPGAVLAYAVSGWFTDRLGNGLPGDASGLLLGAAVIGLSVVVLARPLRIPEVGELVAPLTRRFGASGRRRRGR